MKNVVKELLPYIIIIVVVILIRTFIITPVLVSGDSMKPTLHDKEMLLERKIGYNKNAIKRYDIVIVKKDGEEIIKRVIGMPGDHISYKKNKLYINDKLTEVDFKYRETVDFNLEEICNCSKIPDDYYLVLGDNRPVSKDSRIIGLISEKEILGKAVYRLWPISKFGSIYK